MRIALDGMGGDNAPSVVADGAVLALKEQRSDVEIVLVGRPEAIEPELARLSAEVEVMKLTV